MRKEELVALRCKTASFQPLIDTLLASFDTLGIAVDDGAKDGKLIIREHEGRGCVVTLGNADLAQRAARVLAPKVGGAVQIYQVSGTNSGVTFRFKAAAHEATVDGHLKEISGVELDFDDPDQQWGGGGLEARAQRVLREYGALPHIVLREQGIGYKRRAAGRPSSPRVATLLTLVKKARTWEGVPNAGERIELKVELAKGGKQSSFCSVAEYEELKKLTGR